MAYNSYFPATYYQYPQQTYYPPQPQMQPQQSTMGQVNQQQSVNNSIIWVNSEAEAHSYPVAPNNAVALWDSSKAAIYLKQTDASGKPTFKAYDLVERKTADLSHEKSEVDKYINKDDLDALRGQIDALMGMLKHEVDTKSKSKNKSEVTSNE